VADSSPRLPILRVPAWENHRHLIHGFCGRGGGVSRGTFSELNLSFHVGDVSTAVQENWRRVTAATDDVAHFTTMQQVHGAHVRRVDHATTDAGEADALVTHLSGIALSVLTADCVPILIVAPRSRVVAAVHAGWRGTVVGIVQRVVHVLQEEYGLAPQDLHAALGPAIGGCCYEVGGDVTRELEERCGSIAGAILARNSAKAWLDLRRVNAALLVRAGVPQRHIIPIGPCTRCAVSEYFSYRAANRGPSGTATGVAATGRQLSFIGWRD